MKFTQNSVKKEWDCWAGSAVLVAAAALGMAWVPDPGNGNGTGGAA